ncbi:nicotinate phosphoribosyltransferase [Thermomicrobiaceae bacterium CFH 74404]|uniref:Nicotinate phosphoribosyltransferase n=1 Tax=Thermalbibacter longus TaxID=2951981 RepID=A0AA42BC45_9BACT|nr:nicotinate phosphoribosyltransferase [Thermalbibacter longus]MCM8750540.1 nicotinate phosphoribosyltransferase [Thermalbibacter longus]
MVATVHQVALSTDLYELTMAASYHALGMRGKAIFSLYVRKLPPRRSFLVVAGITEALRYLEQLHFDDQALDYLRSLPVLPRDFVDSLASFRFTGDIWAVREGTVLFPEEPVLEVEAPILEAQLIETLIINAIHYPSLVATKAARCRLAAPGKVLVDFGLRRTPSFDAGLAAARAAYLAGFASTSNVLAGERYGIPVTGTVAHSFIEAFPSELEAFRAFARTYPGDPVLLIDTYDTLRGAQHAVQVARELRAEGRRVRAVRLDSGDLAELSKQVRRILDEAGFPDIQIFASGGLDEFELAALTAAGAPIDGYGVGSRLGTSEDAPLVDMAYKLVEYDGRPALKLSTGKQTLVGPKQVWRHLGADGRFDQDLIAARDEPSPGPGWQPLLQPVMRAGRLVDLPSVEELRAEHLASMERLPESLRRIDRVEPYPVRLSPVLQARQQAAVAAIRAREGL